MNQVNKKTDQDDRHVSNDFGLRSKKENIIINILLFSILRLIIFFKVDVLCVNNSTFLRADVAFGIEFVPKITVRPLGCVSKYYRSLFNYLKISV